ncbi:MAG TPA: type II toxin-antitoxin system VapC family toxin [Solirubrobacteraceae bacterium]|nr:type II toxin-antitoxin system VapC family toxin [Solirubrobacteraceae bacterium]
MARLIVLDASFAIAALSAGDAHHDAAVAALAGASDDELVLAATTRAEILVGPAQAGGEALAAARDFAAGCETVPVSAPIADDAAALKALHRGLSLPDAIALVIAEMIDADVTWTFARRWRDVQPRVAIP